MKTAYAEEILENLWDMYGSSLTTNLIAQDINNSKAINEFFFVILGGYGISYEQNISGLSVLIEKGFINNVLYRSKEQVDYTAELLRYQLCLPQFEPRTKEGNLRKYRFVGTKPFTIASAGLWLWDECQWEIISEIKSLGTKKSRDWLCECPGMGMKSASWLLRNIGVNDDCAVFDVHILRFLSKIGLEVPDTLTTKAYLKLENILRLICEKIGVSLGSLDYLLWILGRNGFLAHVGG